MSTRWEDVLRELEDMRRSIIRLLENAMKDFDMVLEEYRREGGRPAYYEVYEGDDEVKVIVELPGVEKEEIDLYVGGSVLTVKTRGDRKYYARILLPVDVDHETVRAMFRNGILTVMLKKKMQGKKVIVE